MAVPNMNSQTTLSLDLYEANQKCSVETSSSNSSPMGAIMIFQADISGVLPFQQSHVMQ
jgi:hypothetical protein